MANQIIISGKTKVGAKPFTQPVQLERRMFDGKVTEEFLRDLSREVNAQVIQTEVEPYALREVAEARVGQMVRKPFKGDKSELVKKNLPLAGKYLFASEVLPDIRKVIAEIASQLQSRSPSRSGFYARNFRFLLDGENMFTGVPYVDKDDYGPILGVTNIAIYSSTLEKRYWPRVFRKVFSRASIKYKGKFDLRFRYTNKFQGVTAKGTTQYYSLPVIEVAQLGRLKGNTGVQIKRPTFTNKKARRNDLIRRYRRTS